MFPNTQLLKESFFSLLRVERDAMEQVLRLSV